MTLPWYPRDMGKYARDTGTLSLAQHGAYNLLLDYYYSTGPINAFEQCLSNAQLIADHSGIYRLCKATTKAEQEAVDFVLKKYFWLDESGFYRNTRADQVIEEQTKKHKTRQRVGRENRLKGLAKQCSSNAGQNKTKTKKESPLPPKGAAPKARGSDSDSGEFFSVEKHLTDNDIQEARKMAPQWDIYFLARIYSEGVNNGLRDKPRKPAAAFIAWCGSYTKGKPP